MAEKKDLASVLDNENQDSEAIKRIKDLSNKVGTVSQERDEALAKAQKAEADVQAKERELQFSNSFVDLVSQYPSAKEHKDDIKAKVLAGYTTEDATVSVLAKAGKLTSTHERESPAGGSASTVLKNDAEKPISQMKTDEKRAKLVELEKSGAWGIS